LDQSGPIAFAIEQREQGAARAIGRDRRVMQVRGAGRAAAGIDPRQ
jgi:hypothetical protein